MIGMRRLWGLGVVGAAAWAALLIDLVSGSVSVSSAMDASVNDYDVIALVDYSVSAIYGSDVGSDSYWESLHVR